MSQFFGYRLDARLVAFWAPLLMWPGKDGVTLTDDGRFVATFGPVRLATALDNIAGAHVTRDYRWWTAAGVRLSGVDDGITFGTNADAGVCVHFHEKVATRVRRSGHSALTVTVADLDGLCRALERPA